MSPISGKEIATTWNAADGKTWCSYFLRLVVPEQPDALR